MVDDGRTRMLVLHGLRLKGFAAPDVVAETVELPAVEVASELDQLVADELVSSRDGTLRGYALTTAGRVHHAALLRDELDRTGTRAAIDHAYRRFLALNPGLLDVCTAWQVRDHDGRQRVNDHTDPHYDAAVIDQLTELHGRAEPVCTDAADALERFAPYLLRLRTALARVHAGDHDWFTKPMLPSYHTVWFELHEDLLATLGLERATEVAS